MSLPVASAQSSAVSALSDNTALLSSLASSLESFSKGIKNDASELLSLLDEDDEVKISSKFQINKELANDFLDSQSQRVTTAETQLLNIFDKTLSVGKDENNTALPLTDIVKLFRSLHKSNERHLERVESRFAEYGYQSQFPDKSGMFSDDDGSSNSANDVSEMMGMGHPLEQVVEVDDETDGTMTTFGSPSLSSFNGARYTSPLPPGGGTARKQTPPATPATPTLASLNLSGYCINSLNNTANDSFISPMAASTIPSGISSPSVQRILCGQFGSLEKTRQPTHDNNYHVSINAHAHHQFHQDDSLEQASSDTLIKDTAKVTQKIVNATDKDMAPFLQTSSVIKPTDRLDYLNMMDESILTNDELLLVTPVKHHATISDDGLRTFDDAAFLPNDTKIPDSSTLQGVVPKPFSQLFSSLLKTPEVKSNASDGAPLKERLHEPRGD